MSKTLQMALLVTFGVATLAGASERRSEIREWAKKSQGKKEKQVPSLAGAGVGAAAMPAQPQEEEVTSPKKSKEENMDALSQELGEAIK